MPCTSPRRSTTRSRLDWDYAYLTASTATAATNVSPSRPTRTGRTPGTGSTATGSGGQLGGPHGRPVGIRRSDRALGFRYWTDGAVAEPGFGVDNIAISGSRSIGPPRRDAGWTFNGFKTTTGTETNSYFNAYVAREPQLRRVRQRSLKTGPYNFGFLNTKPDWVEHFPYQDGILISYWDSSFTDNNTSEHPGGGLILPIDAHPTALVRPDDRPKWRARVQSYDSTFGLQSTDALSLHINGVESKIPSLPGVSVFNDSTDFWDPSTPLANVITPNTGTTVRIKSMTPGGFAQIEVR